MPQSGAGKPRDALYVSYRPFRASFRSVAERSRSSVFSFDSQQGTCRMLAPLFGGSQSFLCFLCINDLIFGVLYVKAYFSPTGSAGFQRQNALHWLAFESIRTLRPRIW